MEKVQPKTDLDHNINDILLWYQAICLSINVILERASWAILSDQNNMISMSYLILYFENIWVFVSEQKCCFVLELYPLGCGTLFKVIDFSSKI